MHFQRMKKSLIETIGIHTPYIVTGLNIEKMCHIEECEKRNNKRLLVCWVLWHINLCRLFNAKSIFMQIVSSISKYSISHAYTRLIVKTFLFQAIQFIQTVLIQLIQFNISIDFVYTQLNVKTVIY